MVGAAVVVERGTPYCRLRMLGVGESCLALPVREAVADQEVLVVVGVEEASFLGLQDSLDSLPMSFLEDQEAVVVAEVN